MQATEHLMQCSPQSSSSTPRSR